MRLLVPVALACTLPGCGPAEPELTWSPVPHDEAAAAFEDALCGIYAECSCPTSIDGCEAQLALEQTLAVATSAGLAYDADCMGELIARYEHQACAAEGADEVISCGEACRPVFGSGGNGAACERYGIDSGPGFRISVDDCDADHECVSGTCAPRCWAWNGAPAGERCDGGLDCVDGLWCDWDTGTCEPLPETGEPCPNGTCAGSWCETTETSVCEPLLANAQSCVGHFMCESGYCPDGRCRPLPHAGEPCYGPCVPGLACVDEVCAPFAAVCEW